MMAHSCWSVVRKDEVFNCRQALVAVDRRGLVLGPEVLVVARARVSRMISELFGPAALAAGIISNAAFEELKMIAALALRRRRESAWAKAVVAEVDATTSE